MQLFQTTAECKITSRVTENHSCEPCLGCALHQHLDSCIILMIADTGHFTMTLFPVFACFYSVIVTSTHIHYIFFHYIG